MAKAVNSSVVNVKNDKAAMKELSAAARNTVTDIVGEVLAAEYGEAHLAEVVSGKTKKKYLYVTVDGVQLQIQFTAKEKPVTITDDILLATYTAE